MKILLMLFLLSSHLAGQRLGFAIEGGDVMTDNSSITAGLCLSAVGAFHIIPELEIEARIGYSPISSDYTGVEASAYLLYKVYNPVYVIGGINYHNNEGSSSNQEGVVSKGVAMPGLGVGVDIFKNISFELIYHRLVKEERWHYSRNPFNNYEQTWSSLTNIIKINLKIHWNI